MTARRTILLATIFFMASAIRADAPEPEPRFKAVITCHNGKLNSGSLCRAYNYQPDGKSHGAGKITCGWLGSVSEIEWKLVRRQGEKDVYRFTRRFPIDAAETATTSKDVEFEGKQVTIFEDNFQCIVISGPIAPPDLKKAPFANRKKNGER
jgi:hypothetical protein